ncbi:hypothetical protein AB0L13_21295 [Saccharopolyspora shandongensis]|uniref:hypothetical protein n=1 Tax=Saccharopolyspora shandongensis TaxID=418495 RepID=UPI003447E422
MTQDEQDLARHELLLRFAPMLPDEVIWQARRWLAAGRWSHAVRLIAQVFREWDEPLPPEAREIMADGVDEDVAKVVGSLEDAVDVSVLAWDFHGADDELSETYAAVVRDYLESQPGTHTAWQAWRTSENGPEDVARVMHLVETAGGLKPHVIAAELADRLWDAGLVSPQVEVFRSASPLDPYYHAPALVQGREIFGVGPQPTIELARFDEENEEREPAGPERNSQITYLNSGEPLTEEDDLVPDLLTDSEDPVVPVTLRTDGTWIWSDLTTFYLEKHGIALPPGLRAHIAESGPEARTPTRREWVAMVHMENAESELATETTE